MSKGRTSSFLMGVGVLVCIAACLSGCGPKTETYNNRLIIESKPEDGADVKVSGEPAGVTPLTLENLKPGPVLVEVTKERFKDAYDTVRVPEEGEQTVTLEMELKVGYVSITSTPDGANVYVDSSLFLGMTPLSAAPIPAGSHLVELRKEGYDTLKADLEVETDYRYTKSYVMTARPGQVEVFSQPTTADIYVNNQLQDLKTPARLTLMPGDYTIAVYTPGYLMAEEVLHLGPAETKSVDLKMREGVAPPGMVLVPAGEFTFGVDGQSPDERPAAKISVKAFYIDKYEVTNAQWKAVFPNHRFKDGLDNLPVVNVTWEQATDYALKVGKRLPTEIEWEKAARGTDGRQYPWGDLWDASLANTVDTSNGKFMEVGKFPGGASPFGCLDMAGNAYEWTSSWYKAYEGNTEIKKDYGQVFRVLRGGSIRSNSFDARAPRRHYDRMTSTRADYGLRCVADVPDSGGTQALPR